MSTTARAMAQQLYDRARTQAVDSRKSGNHVHLDNVE